MPSSHKHENAGTGPLRVGLVGVGGFGGTLLQYIAKLQQEGRFVLASACDIRMDKHRSALTAEPFGAVRAYQDYDEFLAAEKQLDAVIIATPIPLHVEMGMKAMATGYNVMLEKPPALTIQDIDCMIAMHRQTGKYFAVGFQHTSEQSFLKFCDELRQGRVGEIRSIAAKGLWKRTHGYFTRTPWAGRLLFEDQYVLDGTINNPFSHLLMNSLLIAGLQGDREALPVSVQAELYQANTIEGEDSSCLRAMMDNGVQVFFCASICGEENATPSIGVIGSDGYGSWDYDGWIRFGSHPDSLQESYQIACDRRIDHLRNFAEVLQGKSERLSCTLEDTRKFVLTANLAFESAQSIYRVDESAIHRMDGKGNHVEKLEAADDYLFVRQMDTILAQAAREQRLFSEIGVEWARSTASVLSAGYREFKLFRVQGESK